MTLIRHLIGCAAALLLAATGIAQAAEVPATSADEQARIAGASAIGRLIYDYDQAAWITTDALMARIPRDQFPPGGGWVVEPRADGALVVTYYAIRDGRTSIMFVAATKDGRVIEERVVPEADHVGLSPVETRMVAAEQVARGRLGGAAGHNPCADGPFNSVVLAPASTEDPVSIYFLTPQKAPTAFPFGGHFRIDVDKEGKIVVDRAFTNSCITMDQAAKDPNGKPVMAFITHLLDPTPTEIHVYLSLWMKMPVAVATRDGRVWEVDGTRISLSDMRVPVSPSRSPTNR